MKKAKFIVEIEYEDADKGIDESNLKVTRYEVEGEYEGLTLALTAGFAFATTKAQSNLDTFKEKLRLLRATASALVSSFGTLRRMGLVKSDMGKDEETEKILGAAIKQVVDYISVGLANALSITPSQVKEVNKEYIDIHNNNKSKNDDNEQQGEGQGDNAVDFDDYL